MNGWNIITEVDGSDPFSFLLKWVIICRFQAVHLPGVFPSISIISCLRFYRIHGTGIFYLHLALESTVHVGKYSSPMDPSWDCNLWKIACFLKINRHPSEVTHNQNAERTAWLLRPQELKNDQKLMVFFIRFGGP